MKILDLGCGNDKYKSPGDRVIGLDISKLKGVDVVWNLEKTPLPLKDDEFDMVYAHHTFEHVSNLNNLISEIYRILKSGGILKVIVPHFSWCVSYLDVTHKHHLSIRFMDYWIGRGGMKQAHYTKGKFKLIKRKIHFSKYYFPFSKFFNLSFRTQEIWEACFLRNLFPASTFEMELECIK